MVDTVFSETDVLRFFNILGHTPKNDSLKTTKDIYTAYFMHECGKGKGKPMKNFATIHGTVTELLVLYEAAVAEIESTYEVEINSEGHGVRDGKVHAVVCPPSMHVVLNQTNLKGRKIKDIELPRVIAVDLDRGVSNGEIKKIAENYKPELIVNSSPGKYHLYWRIQATSLENWQMIQSAFAYDLDGDTSLEQYNKTLRVPGFYRLKEGENGLIKLMPQVKWYKAEGRARTYNEFLYEYPWILEAADKAKEKKLKQLSINRKLAAEFLKNASGTVKAIKNNKIDVQTIYDSEKEYGRNQTMYNILTATARAKAKKLLPIDGSTTIDSEEVKEKVYRDISKVCISINNLFSTPLDVTEVEDLFKNICDRISNWIDKRVERITEYKRNILEKVLEANEEKAPKNKGKTKKKKKRNYSDLKVVKKTTVPKESIEKLHHDLHSDITDSLTLGSKPKYEDYEEGEDVLDDIIEEAETTIEPFVVGVDAIVDDSAKKLPNSLSKAAEMFASVILKNNAKTIANVLIGDIEVKNTIGTSQLVVREFLKFGSCSNAGPCVVLKGKSNWKTTIASPTTMTKEQWIAFINRVMYQVVLELLHKGKEYNAAGIIKKMCTASTIKKIADGTWEECLLQRKRNRQAGNIIAFQNGYLNLDDRRFVLDPRSPINHSHPIHANFRPELAPTIKSMGYTDMASLMRRVGMASYSFFNDWFPEDDAAIDIMLTWLGYCMTTDISKQKFVFMHGPTGAGKGSVSQVMCGIVGASNYVGAEYKVLDGGFKASALYDKLIVSIEECGGTPSQHRSRLEFLKKITGGERLQIEPKYVNPFDDYLVGKFILQSNSVPVYEDEGQAISQRMVAVGFDRSYRSEGTNVLPSQQILNDTVTIPVQVAGTDEKTDLELPVPDVLATMAGLLWMERREYACSFIPETNSPAILRGQAMMDKGMNLIRNVLSTYFTKGDGVVVPTAALREFIEWYADDEEGDIPSSTRQLNKQIDNYMNELYPNSTVYRPNAEDGIRVRCWSNVTISAEFDTVLRTLEEDTRWMGTYRDLAEWVTSFSPILEAKRKNIVSFM